MYLCTFCNVELRGASLLIREEGSLSESERDWVGGGGVEWRLGEGIGSFLIIKKVKKFKSLTESFYFLGLSSSGDINLF